AVGGGRFDSDSRPSRGVVTAAGNGHAYAYGRERQHENQGHHHHHQEHQASTYRSTTTAYSGHHAPIVTAAGTTVPGSTAVMPHQQTATIGHAVSSSVTTAAQAGVTGTGIATAAQGASGRGGYASAGQNAHFH
ncbi:MAG: hypothetical protein KGN39_07145, partial [Betaproteobacteria bacterium]|nr:hypothetical protein [Betaproteobacteria bacterium]